MALRPYIVGNWKMNGLRGALAEARAIDRLAQRYPSVEIALAPPATLLHAMALEVSHIGVGRKTPTATAAGLLPGRCRPRCWLIRGAFRHRRPFRKALAAGRG
jgi:triosephosphate isomerase